MVQLSETRSDRQNLTSSERLLLLIRKVQNFRVEVPGAKEVALHTDAGLHTDITRRVLALQALDLGHGDKVATQSEVVEESGSVAEALEDDTLGELRIQTRETIGHSSAEAVSCVGDTVELVLVTNREHSISSLLGEDLQSGEFEEDLDFVDCFALGRGADAKTVPSEGRVAVAINGGCDVGVVVLVEWEIPIAAVEADAVGEDLEGVAWA